MLSVHANPLGSSSLQANELVWSPVQNMVTLSNGNDRNSECDEHFSDAGGHPHHSLICSVWVIISLLLHYLHSIDINSGCMTSQNGQSIIHVAGINVPLSGWCKQQIFTKHVAWNKPGRSIQLRFFAQNSRAIAIRSWRSWMGSCFSKRCQKWVLITTHHSYAILMDFRPFNKLTKLYISHYNTPPHDSTCSSPSVWEIIPNVC